MIVVDVEDEDPVAAVLRVIADAGHGDVEQAAHRRGGWRGGGLGEGEGGGEEEGDKGEEGSHMDRIPIGLEAVQMKRIRGGDSVVRGTAGIPGWLDLRGVGIAVETLEEVAGDEGLEVGGLRFHPGDDHFAAEVEAGVVPAAVGGFGDENVTE